MMAIWILALPFLINAVVALLTLFRHPRLWLFCLGVILTPGLMILYPFCWEISRVSMSHDVLGVEFDTLLFSFVMALIHVVCLTLLAFSTSRTAGNHSKPVRG